MKKYLFIVLLVFFWSCEETKEEDEFDEWDEDENSNNDKYWFTKDKIDKEEPLRIEYTITITIIYLGVELDPTTSEIGTKVTTMQTA